MHASMRKKIVLSCSSRFVGQPAFSVPCTGTISWHRLLSSQIDKTSFRRLPALSISGHEEFSGDANATRLRWAAERAKRITSTVVSATWDRAAWRYLFLTVQVTVVVGLGEASLLVNLSHEAAALFILNYAFHQVIPSIVWMTQSAELVATSIGYSASELLLSLDPSKSATRLLAIGHLEAIRSVAAGFGMLSQLIRIGNIMQHSIVDFNDRVKLGQEPPLSSGPGARIVRLCGASSDVTFATVKNGGCFNILPIISARDLPTIARLTSENFRYPSFLDIPLYRWGHPHIWKPLLKPLDASWLLHGCEGKKILCLEADGTNADENLIFGSQSLNIGILEASMAFRAISIVALDTLQRKGCKADDVRVLRVYLGDSLEKTMTGAGHAYTARQRIDLRHEVDIFIDSNAPSLHSVLAWIKGSLDLSNADGSSADRPTLCFETSCPERFQNLKVLLEDVCEVVDQAKALKMVTIEACPHIPRLIHYPTTAATVNASFGLTRSADCWPAGTLVLCSRLWGAKELRDAGLGFNVVCSAEINDNLLREVRQWAQQGYTSREIQHEVDTRYLPTVKLMSKVARTKTNV